MIKLYIFYFIVGLFMLYMNLFIWGFSAGATNIMPYITLASSIILFAITSGLSLFYIKPASIIAIISLLGVSPFGFYLIASLSFGETRVMIFDAVILVLLGFYIAGLFYSIKNIIDWKKPNNITPINNIVRYLLAFFPVALLILWAVNLFIRF